MIKRVYYVRQLLASLDARPQYPPKPRTNDLLSLALALYCLGLHKDSYQHSLLYTRCKGFYPGNST